MLSAALQRNAKQAFKHIWSISVMQNASNIDPIESLASRTSSAALQLRFAQNDEYEMVSRKPRGFICL